MCSDSMCFCVFKVNSMVENSGLVVRLNGSVVCCVRWVFRFVVLIVMVLNG